MIVRKLRLQRGWTQEHLAEVTGLSVRSIQRIERGQPYSMETRNSLAATFEVDHSILKPGEANMNDDKSLKSDEAEAIDYVRGLKEFYGHVFMYLTFVLVFGLVFGLRVPMIMWGAIGWTVGVVVHGLAAYEVINFLGPSWEKKQVERRLGRGL
jgi:transcriptional regulator with XRE-family HTH domain